MKLLCLRVLFDRLIVDLWRSPISLDFTDEKRNFSIVSTETQLAISGPEFAGGGRTTEIFFRCIVHAKHKRLDRSELKVTQYRNPSWRYLKEFLILCRRKNNVKTESSFTFRFCWTYIGETFFAFKSSPTKERKEMDKLSPSVSLSFDRQLCKRNLSNTVGKVRWRIYACELSSSFPLSQNQFL